METQDRQAIEGLFDRLATVERQAPPRDASAEAFIGQRINQQPAAPYFMAQTIVMQEAALNAAQSRIEELEHQASRQPASGGGFFSSLFGGGGAASRPAPRQTPPQPMMGQGGGGGGFLAGAAQTAMGVAGGVLLGNAIAGMFAGDPAEAATLEEEPMEEPAFDEGADMEF